MKNMSTQKNTKVVKTKEFIIPLGKASKETKGFGNLYNEWVTGKRQRT